MKKLFMSFMAMLLSGVMFMPAVFADTTLGTVSDVTNKDTTHSGAGIEKPVIADPQGKNITITYKGLSLKTLGDGGIQRPEGKAWIGIKVENETAKSNAKIDVTYFDETQNKYVTLSSQKYDDVFDSEGNVYFGVNADRLKGAMEADTYGDGMLRFVLEFDWDATGGVDQTVTLLVDPSDTTIYDENNTTEDWNNDTYNEVLDSLTSEDPTTPNTNASTNNTSKVTVNKKANLDDVPKTGVVYSVINYLA